MDPLRGVGRLGVTNIKKPDRIRGTVLLTTLWVIALLSLIALALLAQVRLGLRRQAWVETHVMGRELLSAMAELAYRRLREDVESDFDSFLEPWARTYAKNSRAILSQFEGLDAAKANFQVGLVPVDESGKVNVNRAPAPLLIELLREAGAGADAADIAAAIVDWRDADNAGAAEDDVYAGLEPAYAPANKDLVRIEELLFVYGVTPALFFGEDLNHNGLLDSEEDDGDTFLPHDNEDGQLQPGLADLLSVFGEGDINVNTAPVSVLQAAFRVTLEDSRAEELARRLIEHRRGRDGRDATDDDKPFRSYEELLAFFKDNLEGHELASLTGGEVQFGVWSSAFRFYLESFFPDEHVVVAAELLVARDEDVLTPLEWHEW